MNNDRKFKIAEKAKFLFEHNIPYNVMAEVLGVSYITLANYYKELKRPYNYRGIFYGKALEMYAETYLGREKINDYCLNPNFSPPDEVVLFDALARIVEVEKINTAFKAINLFSRYLQAPTIVKISPILESHLRLMESILHINILEPAKNHGLINGYMEAIMTEVVLKESNYQNLKSVDDFISLSIEFIAKNISREKINHLSLKESEITLVVSNILDSLPKMDSYVLSRYFGLANGQKMTLKEIGEIRKLSQERVRQIKEKALHRLRMIPDIKELVLAKVYTDDYLRFLESELKKWQNNFSLLQKSINNFDEANFPKEVLEKLIIDWRETDISVRAFNILRFGEIRYVYEVVQMSEYHFLKFRGAGKKTLVEMKEFLQAYNLSFGMVLSQTQKKQIEAALIVKV